MLQIRWPSLPDFTGWANSASGIKLPKVKAHEIEAQPEKRARTLILLPWLETETRRPSYLTKAYTSESNFENTVRRS